MKRITAVVAGLLLAFVGTSATYADTINVPDDQPTIAAAISASSDGDIIAIAAGTHHEYNIDPDGKAITIQGTLNSDGSLATTIDAQQDGGVFLINSGEGDGTVIKDLVITGGTGINDNGAKHGGGIWCYGGSSPTITNCTISGNTAPSGGGIFCYTSSPTITFCEISNNIANTGGGIYCLYNSNPTIAYCTITNNTANGSAGGIVCNSQCSPTITFCEISSNSAGSQGGGIFCYIQSNPTINGASVCNNTPDQTYEDSSSSMVTTMCWINDICDGSPYLVNTQQQEQIDLLLDMHAQQQSAIEDLQEVVAACCAAKTCAGDENNDGVVNIDDLLIVISVWGPCP